MQITALDCVVSATTTAEFTFLSIEVVSHRDREASCSPRGTSRFAITPQNQFPRVSMDRYIRKAIGLDRCLPILSTDAHGESPFGL
jgi:hypothetical protein